MLFIVDGRKYAGHYHTNGYFYVADYQKYKIKLFNAEGPKVTVTGFTTKYTSWEYIEEQSVDTAEIEEILARVVQNCLRRCPRPSTHEENASRIATMCFDGDGDDTSKLIDHYENLEEAILLYLKNDWK